MTELITLLSSGRGSWTEVSRLMKSSPWERVFLITDEFGKERFSAASEELIVVDFRKDVMTLRDEIKNKIEGKLKGIEVALHMGSGDGKEHMALLSALLKLGVGFRIVTVAENRLEVL